MCDLFDDIAREISHTMNIKYNETEANNSLKFLKDVHVLPKDAKEIYLQNIYQGRNASFRKGMEQFAAGKMSDFD